MEIGHLQYCYAATCQQRCLLWFDMQSFVSLRAWDTLLLFASMLLLASRLGLVIFERHSRKNTCVCHLKAILYCAGIKKHSRMRLDGDGVNLPAKIAG